MRQIICVPVEKIDRAKLLIGMLCQKKKVTLLELQKLCGFLNFLCKAVVPGRTFTRRLYAYTGLDKNGKKLLPHHHIRMTGEMKADLRLWQLFLEHPTAYCRPFMDFTTELVAEDIELYTDASKNFMLGMGGFCGSSWFVQQWDSLVEELNPSIEYLELLAVTAAVLLWIRKFQNRRICLFCDNLSVVHMLNSQSSMCRNYMVLIRLITLESMYRNVRIFGKHVRSEQNGIADALSRLQFNRFNDLSQDKDMDSLPVMIPECIWPIDKIWLRQ